jgi:hypothetical protein
MITTCRARSLTTIAQLHAAANRSPAGLPPRGVVIGSAQSGDQIAEELLAADRRVMLADSPFGRATRPAPRPGHRGVAIRLRLLPPSSPGSGRPYCDLCASAAAGVRWPWRSLQQLI